MTDRIENLLSQLTLEEKVSMLAGADSWTTVPIGRLGIPPIKMTDGPNGARGAEQRTGPPSVCFPVGVALGATWNPDLVQRVGAALGQEVKAKGAHILLAPTVNIHRSPLAGRNFECYSEDPYLSGMTASAYIRGLQSEGVGACIKHYVCNDSEFERFTMSSEVGERPLREIYLTPFRLAMHEARPWCVMSSYNKINGTWASENPCTLLQILKDKWGFDGIVVSDWYGSNSINVVNGGLDLEMPGPARWMGDQVLEAVRGGEVSEALIDDKVRRLLRTIERCGAFENPGAQPERAVDRPEHRQLVREAAGEAIVLLKNSSSLLPLDLNQLDSIAVIGENARWAQVQGGGSAHVRPHYVVSPLEGIQRRVGDAAQVGYAIGCATHKMLPLIDPAWLSTEGGSRAGLTVALYDNPELAGDPVHCEVTQNTELVWFGDVLPYVDARAFSVKVTGTLTVPTTQAYTFGLMSVGLSRLWIDGRVLIDDWRMTHTGQEKRVQLDMVAGEPHRLVVEYAPLADVNWRSLRLGGIPAISPTSIDDAARLAAASDVAIVVVGLTDEWESEGFDRPDMELPGDQVELIQRVAAANPRTAVVLNVGSPISMGWLDSVPAVVETWYTGQEAGNALADVLFGDVNPSGRLPTTFPRRLQDNPAYINYPGENGEVLYGEGIFVGYRYYDKKGIEPLFPFGFGLSYTQFAYRNLILSAPEYKAGDEIGVSVEVQNTGALAGKEVVQLYLRDVESRLVRPEKELKAFAKVALEPGETRTITFLLNQDALTYYDPARSQWVAEAGEFEVLVGGSAKDIHLTGRFALQSDLALGESAGLHTGLTMQELLKNARAKAVLEKYVPEVIGAPQMSMAMGMSLDQIATFVPQVLTPDKLKAINEELAAL
jgi:beta-glucosidase